MSTIISKLTWALPVLLIIPAVRAEEAVPAEKTTKATSDATATATASSDAHPRVKLETTLGDIVLELDPDKAPISVENFLTYVSEGFYDGTIFHRVMPGFMIQGGGFDENVDKKTAGLHPAIKNESKNGLSNARGTIAMARTGDPHSATNQFFINVVDNQRLDASARQPWGYAVFGKVVEGLDVVDKIRHTECTNNPKYPSGKVVPKIAVVIKKATKLPKKEEAKPVKPEEKVGE